MAATVVRPDGEGLFRPSSWSQAVGQPIATGVLRCFPEEWIARLFAEAFADAGIASIRYDKRASGLTRQDNLPNLIGRMSMQSHLDELVEAVVR